MAEDVKNTNENMYDEILRNYEITNRALTILETSQRELNIRLEKEREDRWKRHIFNGLIALLAICFFYWCYFNSSVERIESWSSNNTNINDNTNINTNELEVTKSVEDYNK